MEFNRFFSFTNEFNTILETLQYTFCKMLWDIHFIPDFNQVYLVESNEPKKHGFFKINSDLIYTPLPGFWEIEYRNEVPKSWEGCPYQLDHQILNFIQHVYKNAAKRESISLPFKQLAILFQQLEKENKMDCSFCKLRKYEMKELNIPLLFIEHFYIGFKECSIENLTTILKPHLESCNYITEQSRSDAIKKQLMTIVEEVYDQHKSLYESAIFNDEDLDPILDQFKRKLENRLLKLLPFLSLKKINFKEWFKSIFMFQLELKEPTQDVVIKRQELCKKILFLLFHLFPETVPTAEENITCLFYDKDSEPKIFTLTSRELYSYHPMLRGSIANKNF